VNRYWKVYTLGRTLRTYAASAEAAQLKAEQAGYVVRWVELEEETGR
jgi:hypothetical protein